MKISFLSSGHYPLDDRIYYHLAETLSEAGHYVEIISSKAELRDDTRRIKLNCFAGDELGKREKIDRFVKCLMSSRTGMIICPEPLAVIAAKKYSKAVSGKTIIIYDVTEWYPSVKNLAPHNHVLRPFVFLKLLLFNIFAAGQADAFIFGEWYKSRPYSLLFPKKPHAFTTYYPDLKYITCTEPSLPDGRLRLCYSGRISLDKGFGNFADVIKVLAGRHRDLKIVVKIIGWFENKHDRKDCEGAFMSLKDHTDISFYDRQPFAEYIELISDTDIFLDLRPVTWENRRSLPIRLFYYAALGRPVIFSDLKAIRREVRTEDFGFLVKPDEPGRIAEIISEYLLNRQHYYTHCRNARRMTEEHYNWEIISKDFLAFVEAL
ncbi:MAG: glycosyltransferase [Bacteroidales bacterium]|nr:glycosyltransferase [Bacteroidales bacterium]